MQISLKKLMHKSSGYNSRSAYHCYIVMNYHICIIIFTISCHHSLHSTRLLKISMTMTTGGAVK